MVVSQIVPSVRVPPVSERDRENMPLLERVMKGVLEAMMENILFGERLIKTHVVDSRLGCNLVNLKNKALYEELA